MREINTPQGGESVVTLWDYDGVFSVHAHEPLERYSPPRGYVPARDRPYFYYAPIHASFVAPIIAGTDAYYLTSERDNVARAVNTKLPELPWVNCYRSQSGKRFNSRQEAIDFYYRDRPVAFITDDKLDELESWAARRTHSVAPTFIAGTDTRLGLQERNVLQLRKWLGTLGVTGF